MTTQSIDFANLSDKITTDVPFDITATASSGLAVYFSIVSGPASISGNTITLDGVAGIVVVRASQSGDMTYEAAPEVEQSFEVNLVDGIEEIEKNLVVVYPNPVEELLHVKLKNVDSGVYELFIHDSLGRTVLVENKLIFSTEEKIIDVSNFADGMYILRIVQNNKIYIASFVKNK